MELQTISQVSKRYGISLRMLRYYEQEGLLQSTRRKDYAYRVYDPAALHRLRQIIILRKLRLPVKQIKAIFDNQDAVAAIEIFQRSISEVNEEITALSTIRSILSRFVSELQEKASISIHLDLLSDPAVLPLVDSLAISRHQLRDNASLDALSRASDVLSRLGDVRVVYLPPMTVASACFAGDNTQEEAWRAIADFVRENDLLRLKPDLRMFKINHDNATGQRFASEVWASIPDGFAVPAPLLKKRFLGGLYAAHTMGEDGFLTYLGLQDWINESDRYQYDYDGNLLRCDPPMAEIDSFGGTRLDPEEVLSVREALLEPGAPVQRDVLLPVRRYYERRDAPVPVPGSREKYGYAASVAFKNKFRIMGFTGIMGTGAPGSDPAAFEEALRGDGRFDILARYRRPGAPILAFGSMDMDSQLRGGWRWSVCLAEEDATDAGALLAQVPYVRAIDAARWLIIEHERGEAFDDHRVCMQMGYTWNGIISGSFTVYPDGRIGKASPGGAGDMVYCWYPIK